MKVAPSVPWWRRLLLALAAVLATLVLAVVIVVVRSAYTTVDPRWSDPSGEPQVIAWFLLVGGFFFLASYLLFSIPLVLLWPVPWQLQHWYGPLGTSLLWPPTAAVCLLHQTVRGFLSYREALLIPELAAFVACGLYLVLLRGAAQAAARSTPETPTSPAQPYKM